jgi:pseudouridine synthase
MKSLQYITCMLFLFLCLLEKTQVKGFLSFAKRRFSGTRHLQRQRDHIQRINFNRAHKSQQIELFQLTPFYLQAKDSRSANRGDGLLGEKKNRESGDQQEKTVVILYHKPKGVITSHSNDDALPSSSTGESKRCTVYDDIKSMEGYINIAEKNNTSTGGQSFEEATGIKSKLHAVGRLDTDTTGLLLLTNDGQLVHHVTNPTASSSKQKKLVKVYDAVIMGFHTLLDDEEDDCDDDIDKSSSTSSVQLSKLLKGVDIGKKYGGMTQPPHELRVLGHPSPKSTLVRIAISEGKNRQVRRMVHAINSGVMNLHRRRIGNIDLEMMQEHDGGGVQGEWRLLTEKEILDGLGWKVRQLDPYEIDETKRRKGSRPSKSNRTTNISNPSKRRKAANVTRRRR